MGATLSGISPLGDYENYLDGPGIVRPYEVVMNTAPEYWLMGVRTLRPNCLEVCLLPFENEKGHTDLYGNFTREAYQGPRCLDHYLVSRRAKFAINASGQ